MSSDQLRERLQATAARLEEALRNGTPVFRRAARYLQEAEALWGDADQPTPAGNARRTALALRAAEKALAQHLEEVRAALHATGAPVPPVARQAVVASLLFYEHHVEQGGLPGVLVRRARPLVHLEVTQGEFFDLLHAAEDCAAGRGALEEPRLRESAARTARRLRRFHMMFPGEA